MISTSDFREGTIYEEAGEIFEILSYQHHRMSQARAVMRARVKNLRTGAVLEKSYRSDSVFREVPLEKRTVTFLYAQGGDCCFMDAETYEQAHLPKSSLGAGAKFLTENMELDGLYLDGNFFTVEFPPKVVLKVASTVPGVRGDSVSNLTKPATLENGTEVKVPLFIKEGDEVRVDTRTGEYVERV
ncbi:MAG: elongation factor P [Elusimicrobia bacterium]|nr:elongation factor P [Elusimicrobiota bacterium]